MMKVDGRKLARDDLYELHRTVIRLHEEGIPVMRIVERTGLSWPTVNAAIKRYQLAGESALVPLARGRKSGTGRILTAEQESEIRDCIRKKRPKYYGLKRSLWDREVVQQLIAQKHDVKLSERVLGNYLHRWDLMAKKSKGRGREGCSSEIRQWLDINYAEILRQARDDAAEIYWLIAPKVMNLDLWCHKSLPKAQSSTSSAKIRSERKLSMVAAANNQGKLHWAICDGAVNSSRQIKFLEALLHDNPRKKLILIRANFTNYASVNFMNWMRDNSHRINIFPESNSRIDLHFCD